MPDFLHCPWGQCEHSYNAHGKDHCLACDCEKPPPPLPAPVGSQIRTDDGTIVASTEPQELEALEMDVCNICSAYVDDRERHVTWHERRTDSTTNLVISISHLDRLVRELQDKVNSLQGQIGALDRAVSPKPAEDF
jgi:hypothetical protein